MAYRVKVKPNVCFAMRGRRKLHLDIYRPDGGGDRRPAVLCIHGGGWYAGNKRDFDGQVDLVRRLAAQGVVAIASDYRLSLEAPFPAQLDDVRAAFNWVRTHADELGVDPDRIGAMGVSAGAHLVSLLGAHEPALRTVVNVCGPMDLTKSGISGDPEPDVIRMVELLVGGNLPEKADLLREASPLYQVHRNMPPFFILHGDADPLVPVQHAHAMAKALEEHGVPATLVITQNGHHNPLQPFDETKPVVPRADEVLARLYAFLMEQLKPNA